MKDHSLLLGIIMFSLHIKVCSYLHLPADISGQDNFNGLYPVGLVIRTLKALLVLFIVAALP